MTDILVEKKVYYTLRIASAMCFIGHGAFGIITKQIWCNYFAVFGIGHDLAYRLMPLLGIFDIALGIIILVYPVRIVLLWLVAWGFITAALRPLAGESFGELIERAGNFGAPLALLVLSGGIWKKGRDLFKPLNPVAQPNDKTLAKVATVLKVIVFLLFVGHGWLNVIGKKGLIAQYTALGFSNPAIVAQAIGVFEIIAAFSVLIRPLRPILLGLFIWKILSELLYPHYELFEWIERGGSYGSLLALWFVTEKNESLELVLT